MQQFRYDICNVAMLDALLKQAGAIRSNQQVDERVRPAGFVGDSGDFVLRFERT